MSASDFVLTATSQEPFAQALERVRAELAAVGFGVLTEIDLQATLRAKLGAELPAKTILGACRPQLALQALEADPRVAALMPCNVVVSETPEGSLIEVMDPGVMPEFTGTAALREMATEARELLSQMLRAVTAAHGNLGDKA